MAIPVQGATNSTGYFQNFIPTITSYGSRLVSVMPSSEKLVCKTMGLGKLVVETVGTIPGVGLGAAAVAGGLFLAVKCGKKSVAHYRDLDIGEGASWGGVLGYAAGCVAGVGLVVIGTVVAVSGLQSQSQGVSSFSGALNETKGNLTNLPTVLNETKDNLTDLSTVLNETKKNISEPLKQLLKPVLERLPCLGETLKEAPKHFEANGSCFYIYP